MSRDLILSALRKGKNGEQILAILDAITGDSDDNVVSVSVEPTLEEIDF